MKIFNKENNKEKVYIQIKDLDKLIYSKINLPKSIKDKYLDLYYNNSTLYDNDFIEFNNENEISFFKLIDWIVDFKRINKLNNEQIKTNEQKIISKMESNFNNKIKFDLLDYKLNQIDEIKRFKDNEINIPIPEVIDSDGFTFIGGEDYKYEIKGGLNPKKIFIYRKDGKELTNEDNISIDFIQNGISIAIMENQKNNYFIGNYTLNNKLSEDNKYIITNFESKPIDKKIDNKSTSIKKYIKKILNKK